MSASKPLLILTFSLTSLLAGESPLVHLGQDGKLAYIPHANIGETEKVNVIPDFSHCGYRGGGVRIPDVPVKAVIDPQDGPALKRIQDAIDQVSQLPLDQNGFRGAVLLKAGTHIISEGKGQGLRINASGVVLRGEGQGMGGTLLKTTEPKRHNSITVGPRAKPEYEEGPVSRISDPYVGTGATTFSIADADGFAVGDAIRVYFTPNQAWLDETYANKYMKKDSTLWTTERFTIPFERKITKIAGKTITIDSPVVCPMQERFGGGEIRKIVLTKGGVLENVGIENLGITCSEEGGDKGRISDAILFSHVVNGWVSGVTATHQYDSLVTLDHSHHVTVQDCASLKPLGPKRGGYRYTYYIGAGSSHCLIQRCYAYDGRHDFVTYAWSPGPNVFLDCLAEKGGTQGPHQRWSSGILFDNIAFNNRLAVSEHRGASGSGHGWTGVSDVAWNVRGDVTCDAPTGFQNYAFGTVGRELDGSYVSNKKDGVHRGYYHSHGTPMQPRSLYLKQLEDRLGKQAVENVTTADQRQSVPPEIYPSPPQFASPVLPVFDKPAEVVISSSWQGATIRYTVDGSDPTPASPAYSTPLKIDKPVVIKAIALDKASRPSRLAEASVQNALRPAQPGASLKPGLWCGYYEGKWPSGKALPDFPNLTPKSVSVATTVELPEGRAKNYYAVLYKGYLEVPEDGVYFFTMAANDGANLLIGGQRILDHEKDRYEGAAGLYAGKHAFEIQFFQKRYGDQLEVFWSGPGFDKSPIPASALSHASE